MQTPISEPAPLGRQRAEPRANRSVAADGAIGNGTPSVQCSAANRHAAANSSSLQSPRSQLSAASRASEVFSQGFLQRRHIQHRFRQQLLQLAVLLFQSLQSLGVRDLHPAVARSPIVERRVADPVLAAQLRYRQSCLMCFFTTPMICSSVLRLFLIFRLLAGTCS